MFQVMGICEINEAIQGFCHPKMALNFIIELTINIVRYFILGTTQPLSKMRPPFM